MVWAPAWSVKRGARSRPGYGRRAIASISTLKPFGSAATSTVERAGGGSGKKPGVHAVHRREVIHVGEEDRRLDDVGEARTGRVEHRPEVRSVRSVSSSIVPCRTSWVAGSMAPWPAQKTRSPATMAWLYGPTAAGAFVVEIA